MRNLMSRMLAVFAETKIPFVILIDEWDCIFRVHQEDEEAQKKYLDYLRKLLKDQPYVALSYMTGILPVKKYGQHSALNMFTEVSMTDANHGHVPTFSLCRDNVGIQRRSGASPTCKP